MDGLGGGAAHGSTTEGRSGLADEVVSSALRYRVQAPLIDELLKEIGIEGGDLNSMTRGFATLASRGDKSES